MKIQPDFGRLKKTVAHEEPDRLPLAEAHIDYSIMSRFIGRPVDAEDLEAQVEFWRDAGYDYIALPVGLLNPGKVTQESAIMKVIRDTVLEDTADAKNEKEWSVENRGYIKDRRSFEAFPWEEASRVDLGKLHQAAELLPEGMKVIAVSGKIFTLTWMLMGFTDFCIALLDDEQLAADIFEKVANIQFHALNEIFKMPHVGGVWAVDDLAFGSGPMIAPSAFRDHVFPWYKEISRRCHENGLLYFQHTDGDIRPIMEDLVDIGLDALHPIDPTCLDIMEMKEKYGERICLLGNVSNELLAAGSEEAVREEVKRLIEKVAPGGGYCLGSGNSVPDWARFENYMAMRNTALECGAY